MPDRFGDDESVVDFDSRRQARETAAAVENARQQRQRLNETRAVHAPLTPDQSTAARRHRHTITDQAEARRNQIRIANCRLCNDDGYRGATVCDHIDRSAVAARGMAAVRAEMGWTPPEPHGGDENG